MIPYVKDILNHQRQDAEWVYWIIDKLIDHWNTEQILQIQNELTAISLERYNDLAALRILWIHGIYTQEEVTEIIQRKKDNVVFELNELRAAYEANKERFNVCNRIQSGVTYLSEIDIFAAELLSSQ